MTHRPRPTGPWAALVVRTAAAAAAALGVVVSITSPLGGLSLAAAGVALALMSNHRPRAGLVVAVIPVLLGLVTLFRHAVLDPPANPAPLTAALLALAGTALVVTGLAGRRAAWATQVLAGTVGQIALVVLVGHAYGVPALYRPAGPVATDAPTAAGLLALSIGIVCLAPRAGFMAVVTAATSGGMVVRRQVPALVLGLILLGGLELAAERAQVVDTSTATALFSVLSALLFALLTLRTGWLLHRADLRRRSAKGRALASAGLARALLEHAPDAVFVADAGGRYLEVNAAACRLLGYARDELLRMGIPDVIPADTLLDYEQVRAAAYEGKPFRGQWELVRKDGSRVPVEAHATVLPDGRWQSFVRDVTEQRRAEAALREADRRKNEFLATLAHELRNPLAPVRNVIHVLGTSDLHGPAARRGIDILDRQLRHLVRLVDDLLDVSRITRGKLTLRTEPVELAAVVASAVEVSRPLIDEGAHELSVGLPAEPVTVTGDPFRLAQVFANLLNNAAKYTDRGGRIDLAAAVTGDVVEVTVRDTGVGIPPAALPRLFDIFSQVAGHQERSQGGLGIGLSLVKGLTELHGGTAEARSEGPGRGSEFVVRLPVARAPAAIGGPPPAVPVSGRRPRTVLVVDDNRDSADSLALLLSLDGDQVRTAYDSRTALAVAAELQPDVVLLDIGMPPPDGHECARYIRQQPWGATALLVAMTGWGQDEDRRRTREAGFDYHLVKPVDPAELRAILLAAEK
jgi:PAS domain S-box-containing protein